MTSRVFLATALASLAGTLGACRVGENYSTPSLAERTGEAWAEAAADSRDAGDLARWWSRLDDAELSSLVERAFSGNLDLVEARERIIAARARRGIENAARLPFLDAEAQYSFAESGDESIAFASAPPGIDTDVYRVGVVAGWELDLWGRVGRLVEAADAEIDFAVEDFRAARASLAAEVAREVITIRALDDRIGVVERGVGVQQETLEIADSRRRAGLVSELDALRARRNLETDRAAIPTLMADRRAAEQRIAVLLGVRPGEIAVSRAGMPTSPSVPAMGLPADLVTRRPDIRRAERELAAAAARTGAAIADRYPRVTLSGQFSFSASDVSNLGSASTRTFSLGPTVTLPVLSGGRIDSNVDLVASQARQALTRLESTTLAAVREVETALARRVRAAERLERLRAALAAAGDAERLASSLYTAGRTDFLDVLDAQNEVLAIEEQVTLARETELAETIALYAALGGGWDPAPEVAATEPRATP